MSEQDHRFIYLSPVCDDGADEGRQWCPDDVFECCCDEGGHKAVKYVLATEVERLEGELALAVHDKEVLCDVYQTQETNLHALAADHEKLRVNYGRELGINEQLEIQDKKLRAVLKVARGALDEIGDPIKYMRKRAAAENSTLNGDMALHISRDHCFLKSIANQARAAIDKELGK